MNNQLVPPNIFFTWDIHYQCNYFCTYCFLNFERKTANVEAVYLDSKEWVKIWEDIHERYGTCQIQVTGGEPFTYPDFLNLISKLSQIHMFSFSTNFSWEVDEFMDKISPARVKIDTSFHPEFVDIKTFMDKVIKLKNNKYLISITAVAYPPLLENMRKFGRIFNDAGLHLIIYPYRGPYQNRNYPEGYTADEKKLLRELGLEIGENVSGRLEERYLSIKQSPKIEETQDPVPDKPDTLSLNKGACEQPAILTQKLCRMGQRYAKIIPNGDAYRCCSSVWDETKPWESWGGLGNLAKRTFRLLSEPAPCGFWCNCSCYKAMIVSEEKRWVREWNNIDQIKVDLEIKGALSLIKKLRDEKQLDEAIAQIQKILAKHTAPHVVALTLLAEIYVENNALQEAEKAVSLGFQNNLDPDNLSWMHRVQGKIYAKTALRAGDPEKRKADFLSARDNLLKAIQFAIDSNNPIDRSQAHYEMAYTFYLTKDFDSALEHIDLAIRYDPKNEFLQRTKAAWNMDKILECIKRIRDKGQYDEATIQLKKMLLRPDAPHITVLTLLAEIYVENNALQEAEETINAGVEKNLDPNNTPWMHRVRGKIRIKRSLHEKDPLRKKSNLYAARECFSTSIQSAIDSNSLIDQSQGHYEMAYAFYLLNDFDKAQEQIRLIKERDDFFCNDESKEESFRNFVKRYLLP